MSAHLSSIVDVGPSSEWDLCMGKPADLHSTFNQSGSCGLCVWGGAGSGLPLGNQFAKADAQQGTNVCGFQQLFSNTHQGTFFLFHKIIYLFIHLHIRHCMLRTGVLKLREMER